MKLIINKLVQHMCVRRIKVSKVWFAVIVKKKLLLPNKKMSKKKKSKKLVLKQPGKISKSLSYSLE